MAGGILYCADQATPNHSSIRVVTWRLLRRKPRQTTENLAMLSNDGLQKGKEVRGAEEKRAEGGEGGGERRELREMRAKKERKGVANGVVKRVQNV